jgi:hypothetical protein
MAGVQHDAKHAISAMSPLLVAPAVLGAREEPSTNNSSCPGRDDPNRRSGRTVHDRDRRRDGHGETPAAGDPIADILARLEAVEAELREIKAAVGDLRE